MSNQYFPRSIPEAQGIQSSAIEQFLDKIHKENIELHSLMLVRHGFVVAEGWWAPYQANLQHMLFSLSKSFTSTAVGLAVQEGLVSLNDAVVSFFPEEVPEEVSENLSIMRIRDLLMMGSGHAEDTMGRLHQANDGNWVQAFLQAPVEYPPGTHFVYNSGATYMLSAILQKVTGLTLLQFLQPRILEPLAITDATWETCPRGISAGGWGLSITTEDIAKFGQLYLQKGVWEGKRLLAEEWIEQATSKQIANGDDVESDWAQGYGYQFWRCKHNTYRGDGAFGQFCIVMPEQDAVLAVTSGTNDMQGVLNAVWEHLLPSMLLRPLAKNKSAAVQLAASLNELSLDLPRHVQNSPAEKLVSGRLFHMESNQEQWNSFNIQFDTNQAIINVTSNKGEHVIRCGRGHWIQGVTDIFEQANRRVAASFTWVDSNSLEVTLRYVETPFCFTVKCRFEADRIIIVNNPNVSFGSIESQQILGHL